MSLRWHLLLGKPLWETGLIFFLSMGWLCTKCMYTICPFCEIWAVCVFWITYDNLYIKIYIYIKVVSSQLKPVRKKSTRCIQKNLKNIILYSSHKSRDTGMYDTLVLQIHSLPRQIFTKGSFFPKIFAWDSSLLSKKYGGLLINQWNLRKSEAGSEATS